MNKIKLEFERVCRCGAELSIRLETPDTTNFPVELIANQIENFEKLHYMCIIDSQSTC